MLTPRDLGRRRQVTLLHLVPTALHWAQEYHSNATQLGRGQQIIQLHREGHSVVNTRWDARAVIIKSANPQKQGAST